MASEITAQQDTWVVCHGIGYVRSVHLAPGQTIATGLDNLEDFPDPLAAARRALELGSDIDKLKGLFPEGKILDPVGKDRWITIPDDIPVWDPDSSYPKDAIVIADNPSRRPVEPCFWLHISDAQGKPDGVYDLEAGTGDWAPIDL